MDLLVASRISFWNTNQDFVQLFLWSSWGLSQLLYSVLWAFDEYAGCWNNLIVMWQRNLSFQLKDGKHKTHVFTVCSNDLVRIWDTQRKPSNNFCRGKHEDWIVKCNVIPLNLSISQKPYAGFPFYISSKICCWTCRDLNARIST